MDGETILTWSPANWITVVLMVALFYTILGAGIKVVKQLRANKQQQN